MTPSGDPCEVARVHGTPAAMGIRGGTFNLSGCLVSDVDLRRRVSGENHRIL